MGKEIRFQIDGKWYVVDYDRWMAAEKFQREQERKLVPRFLWGLFGLLESDELNNKVDEEDSEKNAKATTGNNKLPEGL